MENKNNFFNITLSNKNNKNILDGITLYEPVDLSILDKLINSTLLKESFNNPMCQKLYQNEKQQLIKYKNLIENGRAKINYKRCNNNPYGRSNPLNGLGLFSIRREIRHTLASSTFEDVDIDNCHPVLLQQTMINNNYKCEILTDYIENRQKWFKTVQKHYKINELESVKINPNLLKDISKNLFIRLLFSGTVNEWKKDNKIDMDISDHTNIKAFENEIKSLNKIIVKNNSELVDIIKNIKIDQKKMDIDGFKIQTKEEKEQNKPKQLYNINGSVSSYFLQEKEITILSNIFKFCKDNKYIKDDNCVLCADGLMIEKHLYKPQLLTQLKEYIKKNTGYELNFSNKAMDQGYNKILDKNLNFDLYRPMFTTGLLADYFKVIYANKFINVNGNIYNYNGVFWKLEEDKKDANLHNFVDKQYHNHLLNYITSLISKQNTKINEVQAENETNNDAKLTALKDELELMTKFLTNINYFLRTVKKRKELVEDIKNKLTCNYVEFDKNPFYLVFNNKIYDLQNKSWVEPEYNQYLSLNTGWDWCDYYNEDEITELNLIIDSIFPSKSVKDHYLMALSTGLYGQQIEKIFIATGRGGNGKSLINGLMMTAVGSYGYKLPSNVLLNEIKEGANPAVANMNNKRFILTQEPDANKRICGSTLKEITGDPVLNCRTLYSTKTTCKLLLSLFLECNDLPKLDEINDGITRRIDTTPFISKFVESSIYNQYSEEEKINDNIRLGNPFYKTDEFKHKYKQALMTILFNYFDEFKNNNFQFNESPQECKNIAVDYMATSDDIYSWFCEYYEKSEEPTFLYYDDLFETFTTSSYYQNMSKKDKREYNLKQFTTKINNNIFMKEFLKLRDTTYNKIKHKKPYIISYKRIIKPSTNNKDNFNDDYSDDEINPLDVIMTD